MHFIRRLFAPNIAKLAANKDVESLIDALESKNPQIIATAKKALLEMGVEAVEGLILALEHPSDEVSNIAFELLEGVGPASIIPLREQLRYGSGYIRRISPWLLGNIGSDHKEAASSASIVPELIRALTYEDDTLRQNAASALGKLSDPLAIEPLCRALSDPVSTVVRNAAWAIAQLLSDLDNPQEHAAATPALLERLNQAEDNDMRTFLLSALSSLAPASLEHAMGMMDRSNQETSAAVVAFVALFARAGHSQALEALVRGLQHDIMSNRLRVVYAMADISDERVVAALNRFCEVAGGEEQLAATQTLVNLGQPAPLRLLAGHFRELLTQTTGQKIMTAKKQGHTPDHEEMLTQVLSELHAEFKNRFKLSAQDMRSLISLAFPDAPGVDA